MPKLSQILLASLLIIMSYVYGTFSNLLYGATTVVYPGLWGDLICGVSMAASATDWFITFLEQNQNCWAADYLLHTSEYNPDSSLTITLPTATTVRTVLLSVRDYSTTGHGIGFNVSIGDTDADKFDPSKHCTFKTNYGLTSTYSITGISAWLTCNNLVGTKLFIRNPTF